MANSKIKDPLKLKGIITNLKKSGKTIVFTNGCFDIVHAGHVRYLIQAKQKGDILIAAINSDSSTRAIKGKTRPLAPQEDRIEVIAGLECVDYVTVFNESTPLNLIKRLKPDILVKGGNWKKKQVVGKSFVEACGGKVIIIPFLKGRSTTGIIKTIIARHK
ncbi:MAG: D-glycero-beta-D-manno-heptose 1-phosphate adenylyltransferase [Candidatus Omnitrophota bacterium]|nr:D-glycero-beta-D-manno-heptose 1-phosphate adenylyltransferase [Candidatus Omnitrophota bacterium]